MLRKVAFFVLAVALAVMVCGCGGGDGEGGGSASVPNSDPVTIAGPGGSTLTTPVGGLNGGAAVELKSAGDTAGLADAGETPVSQALEIDTSDDGSALMGDGAYSLSIPVDESAVTDVNKLELKVKLTSGAVYPVFGVYDSKTGTFTVELAGLVDGWVVMVVENPTIQTIFPSTEGKKSPKGWMTDQDWETFEWTVVNHTAMTEADVRALILPVMWDASETLSKAGFRSPKIYIDPRLSPAARVVHLIGGIGPNDNGSHFHAGVINYADGTWTYTEDVATFDTTLLDDEQMTALGQMYVNYDQFIDLNAKYGVSLGNIVIHELFHAVQYGYDVRKNQASLKAYLEGTATPLGQTYQSAAGSVTGPSVAVRVLRPNEHARLYQAVDDPTNPLHYTKQDFFAYVAKRYGGNSFAYADQLFEYLNNWTAGKFGLTAAQYRELYRKAMDDAFQALFGKSLPAIYREYATDRAYEHDASWQLRPAEETEDNGFGRNHIAKTVFQWSNTDEKGLKELDPEGANKVVEFPAVEPLSCYAFYMILPSRSETDEQESFPLMFKLEGGDVTAGSEGGIKIVAYIEDMNETMLEGGKIEITDVSKPVQIPFLEGGEFLTVLVMNCYLEDKSVKVTVSAGPYLESLSPNPAVPGAQVTVRGVSFGAAQGTSTLHLGNDEITEITSWSDTEIVFTVPATADSDKVKVTVGGVASNEVQLSVGETAGNWEMRLDIWNAGELCEDTMPHYWDFMKMQEWVPVTVAENGNVTFEYTGSAVYYQFVGGSNLHVWGTGTFLNNTLNVTGQWTHVRTWSEESTVFDPVKQEQVPVVETWTLTCDGTFAATGHFDTIVGYWWGGDLTASFTTTSSYVKYEDGNLKGSESNACAGTLPNTLMNDIADFRKK